MDYNTGEYEINMAKEVVENVDKPKKEELEEKVDAEMESVAALMAVQPKKKKD